MYKGNNAPEESNRPISIPKRRHTNESAFSYASAATNRLALVGIALLMSIPGTIDLFVPAALLLAVPLLALWNRPWARLRSNTWHNWMIAESPERINNREIRPFGPRFTMNGTSAPPQGPVPETFWGALSADEKKVLLTMGTLRTFALGATLFHEGEQADFVVIIRSGKTRIYVTEHGQEQVLAERGPGQLIGERAALEVNVRSATVVALGTVEALILTTANFAEFISRHPHVLRIVEGQIYRRLTEGPGQYPTAPAVQESGGAVSASEFPSVQGHICTMLRTDIVGFASHARTAADRLYIQEAHLELLRESIQQAEVSWNECFLRTAGDELLLVAPHTVPAEQVVLALDKLHDNLKTYDGRAAFRVKIRLRASINVGPLTMNAGEPAGDPLIVSARLLDAGVLREAMNGSGALLGELVPAYVYENVIEPMGLEGFRRVDARSKDRRTVAWMRLRGPTSPC